MTPNDDETYLGDGLYASFDGYMVALRAPREGGDHFVSMEPEVLHAFERYVNMLRERRRQASAGTQDAATNR